jgi:FkbM family methyltransferase
MATACDELDALLDRDPKSERRRESSWFDHLTQGRVDRLVLFGAGNVGRRVLRGLRDRGVEPCCFADNNPALWGKSVDELGVLSPEDAAGRFRAEASFVVTIFSQGSGPTFPAVRGQLHALGCPRVVPFAALAWKFPDAFLPDFCIDLPHKIAEDAEGARAGYALWADEESRREYLDQLRWRLDLDFDGLSPPSREPQYFPRGFLSGRADEVFVDCGAFDGDTIRSFLKERQGRFEKIIAFEPDPKNYRLLADFVSRLPQSVVGRVELHRAGTSDRREQVRFAATGNSGAAICQSGGVAIDCVPLDEALEGRAPTYVKMDIEGAEPRALAGASHSIRTGAPALAVCVYHSQNHLWRVPLQIQSLYDGYDFFLRRYQEECWEAVCYAVPRSRVLRP